MLLSEPGRLVTANRTADVWGLVRRERLAVRRLNRLVLEVAADGATRLIDGHLPALPGTGFRRPVRAGVAAVAEGLLVTVEDRSELGGVDRLRRDLLANLGHELKTPVGALALLAEAALAAVDDPVAREGMLRHMQEETARLAVLVRGVLELARIEGGAALGAAQTVAAGHLVEAVLALTRPTSASAGVTLGGEASPRLLVHVHPGTVIDALRRLVDNAVAASPAGGVVEIVARRHDGMAEFAVRDEGDGVPGELRDRIFERFYRADFARSRRSGGAGLGLAIVKHVAERYGGGVSVRTRVAGGAVFVLRLPLADRAHL